MLTKKQKDLLILIHERMASGEIAPSFDEMKEALGLKSKSGIHRLITALVERGYLERLPHRARALEVKKLPEGYQPKTGDHSLAARTSKAIESVLDEVSQGLQQIPLYGKIAAGTPIEAIRNEGDTFEMPAALLGAGEYYALTVEGDSMINAGIHDADIVIIKRTENVRDGQIAVALVDGEEVTLKRIQRKDGHVILHPENDDYEPRTLSANRVKIQGELATLYRTYH